MADNFAQQGDCANQEQSPATGKFEIFRYKDAKDLDDHPDALDIEPLPEKLHPLLMQLREAGIKDGSKVKYLVKMPGFSLTHVWFKRDFPLPLHSHNSDCLYYIVAGTIRLGTEDLGPRDSFFVPSDVPYTYRAGPEGVELLEFRHATSTDLKQHAKSEKFWEKAIETVKANHEEWIDAKMPPLNC
jgi:mannose-6-phosphate isomerase-like protein (cupin superfamily)